MHGAPHVQPSLFALARKASFVSISRGTLMMLYEDQACSCHISWKSILNRLWQKGYAQIQFKSAQDNHSVYSSQTQRSTDAACQGIALSKISITRSSWDAKTSKANLVLANSSLDSRIFGTKFFSASKVSFEAESSLSPKYSSSSFTNAVTALYFSLLATSAASESSSTASSASSKVTSKDGYFIVFITVLWQFFTMLWQFLVALRQDGVFFTKLRGMWLGLISGLVLLSIGQSAQAAPQNQVNTQVEVDASVISPDMEGTFTAVKGPVPDRLLPMGPQFRIAVFNLNYALNHKMRMDTVAKALKRLNAEIILLQNVDKQTVRTGKKSDATAELAQELSMNYAYGPAQKVEGGGTTGLAILSKYPILQSEIIPLPSLSDGQGKIIEQRILLMSQIMIQGFERPIIIMNTHLDPYGKTEVQIRQIMRLNELLLGTVPYNKIDDFLTKIKILGGCFMTSVESDVMQELTPYWNHLHNNDRLAMRNYPLINPLADVDHIYTSRAQVWNLKKFEVLKGTERGVHWERCTDHAPIVAEIQLIEQ